MFFINQSLRQDRLATFRSCRDPQNIRVAVTPIEEALIIKNHSHVPHTLLGFFPLSFKVFCGNFQSLSTSCHVSCPLASRTSWIISFWTKRDSYNSWVICFMLFWVSESTSIWKELRQLAPSVFSLAFMSPQALEPVRSCHALTCWELARWQITLAWYSIM
jgi:hypothetical protein